MHRLTPLDAFIFQFALPLDGITVSSRNKNLDYVQAEATSLVTLDIP